MKFGLLYDLRNPPPWRRPMAEHYRRGLESAVRAEELGADVLWFSEHHCSEDGYLPQPLTFAAAAAARTTRVRLGTAIVLAALRHPLHLAEQAAVVDLLSGGRLELGLGAGFARDEYAAFGVDVARRFGLTDAAAAEVDRLLRGELSPPPVQRPVPIWLGYQGPKGARRAGRLGFGLLSLAPELIEPYRAGLVEGGHDPASARMGGLIDIVVADDPAEAFERILPHYAYQLNSYRAMAGSDTPVTVEQLRAGIRAPGRIPGLRVLNPTDAIATIRAETAGLPVEYVHVWASIAGMPDELADRHVELFFTEVAPALR